MQKKIIWRDCRPERESAILPEMHDLVRQVFEDGKISDEQQRKLLDLMRIALRGADSVEDESKATRIYPPKFRSLAALGMTNFGRRREEERKRQSKICRVPLDNGLAVSTPPQPNPTGLRSGVCAREKAGAV